MYWQTDLRKEILKDIGIQGRGRKLVFFWPIMMSLGLGIWSKKNTFSSNPRTMPGLNSSSLKMRGE